MVAKSHKVLESQTYLNDGRINLHIQYEMHIVFFQFSMSHKTGILSINHKTLESDLFSKQLTVVSIQTLGQKRCRICIVSNSLERTQSDLGTMGTMSSRNHYGFYLHAFLFGVCIFLTLLSLQVDGLEAAAGGGSSFNSSRLTDACSKAEISLNQQSSGLVKGIPVFSVEILNQCSSGCAITNIHVSCGQFASAVEVNPKLFRRLAIGDCLVNDGQPLDAGNVVSFRYANSFIYPLSVTSVTCLV